MAEMCLLRTLYSSCQENLTSRCLPYFNLRASSPTALCPAAPHALAPVQLVREWQQKIFFTFKNPWNHAPAPDFGLYASLFRDLNPRYLFYPGGRRLMQARPRAYPPCRRLPPSRDQCWQASSRWRCGWPAGCGGWGSGRRRPPWGPLSAPVSLQWRGAICERGSITTQCLFPV